VLATLAWARQQPWIDRHRIVLVGTSMGGLASIAAAAANNSPNLDASKLSVNVTYCPAGATQATGNAQVSISYPYSFLAAVTGSALTVTITGQATMPCGG